MKTCSMCKINKPLGDFYNQTKGLLGKQSRCKTCQKESWKGYSEKRHWSWISYAYGVTEHQYRKMYKEQKGCCAICNLKQIRKLCVDHCHRTRRIRGLLCPPCNAGLGQFREDVENLESAIKYLKRDLKHDNFA